MPIFLTRELVSRLYISHRLPTVPSQMRWAAVFAIGFFIVTVFVIGNVIAIAMEKHRQNAIRKSPFLDYMPDVPRPCPSDYRCGGTSREQVRMENRLYTDLRESSKYALPETMTPDAYDVPADAAEPVTCMLNRAARATEAPQPEGQYTPWDEIESGFLSRSKKKPMELQVTKTFA